ncbi:MULTISPECIES: dihydroxyacetone kinase subunit DhaL [unclassified Actinopolyspora]|uniref:dihydroxyacetone kinase subunit DhaL n=1 Tax=Actinopolyspora TaxID=1849 RepID=UPI0013F61CD7|nr:MULTISPECIES: dihydroxyacetone kinase subunit DhaL [unclassified Actinopolyspora]NHD18762.1 dihydroxyacetone kinase subunit L [Actinopolyspora sp. BKK2]NHE77916.1 dihydroxyacetone kinase subunit L [Actinopolyspora sp. BKK1]
MSCTTQHVVAAMRSAADSISEHRDELVELDRAIGDGDHGENMERGFLAVRNQLELTAPESPAAALKSVATSLISSVGGASGPLFGTAFLRASTAVGEAESLDGPAVAGALRAALDGVTARGKAEREDKTMVDALAPAAEAAEAASATGGSDPGAVLRAAAEAAETGARTTVSLIAKKGRASYLGDRSAGHLDPGARSVVLLLNAFADVTGVE